MGYQDHKQQAGRKAVACAVITCSDTRKVEEDESGQLIKRLLEEAGHTHPVYRIVKDDPQTIRALIAELAGAGGGGGAGSPDDVQAIILNGGTGVSRRDNTFDAVSSSLTKTLPGFGEIFRMLSYQSIGSGALLSRATAGIIVTPPTPLPNDQSRHTVIFSIPGSPNAVELAMSKLIIPELTHLVWELNR
jgi:molybdenum cofactor biosynthesis protein B